MADIFRRYGVNGVLGDIGGMIAYPFETARNKDQIQIAAELIGVLGHSLDQFDWPRFISSSS